MTTLERTTAIGVFTDRAAADAALEELNRVGFAADQLGFAVRDRDVTERTTLLTSIGELNAMQSTGAGAMGGGIIGGIAGAAVSLLIPGLGPALAGGMLLATLGGVAMGAVAGGFVGSLIRMGVPEEEAHRYQDLLTDGHSIVTVQASERYEEALKILAQHGAYNSAMAEVADASASPSTQALSPSIPVDESEPPTPSTPDLEGEKQTVQP
ncbi:MAG: hypothetical protein H0U76_14425 [Ktedonobacteraceae bacterium]|nr:hypothetical protein [Ktedonobacteraceae bacterium]